MLEPEGGIDRVGESRHRAGTQNELEMSKCRVSNSKKAMDCCSEGGKGLVMR